jgi:putative nucleotidyltransferase with HDIG domain
MEGDVKGSGMRVALYAFTMPGSSEAAVSRPRGEWDTPSRSAALERFYRDLMAVDKLPSPPEIAQRMLVAVNHESTDVRRLADIIARDQSAAARLLRLANSAFFAIRTKVTSIHQAVTLLGFGRVRDLVVGLSVWNALGAKSPAGRRYRSALAAHSATVAAACKLLAERTGGDGPTAFTAGLLHDIGKLVLGLRLGDSYWTMLDDARESGENAATVELQAFQCQHATVGGWLLQLWQLPPALVDAVALHHDPLAAEYGLDLPSLVAIADRLVNASNPANGEVRSEALDEVRSFAPGLLDATPWKDLYTGLAREKDAIVGIFGA